MVSVAPLVAATDLDAERALLTQALDIRRRVLPPNDPDLAITLGALAGHHQRRGELERSRELYRQALAVFRDPGERRHPASVTLMGDYGSLLSTLKAYDEAEATLREAIAVGEQVLGPGTLTVADLTNDLAVVLAAVGRHGDAERAFRESFDRHVVLFGESHWRIRNVARNLGLVLVPAAALPGGVAMDGPRGVDPRLHRHRRDRPRGDSGTARVGRVRRGPFRGSTRCRKPGRLGARGHEGPQRRARSRLLTHRARPDLVRDRAAGRGRAGGARRDGVVRALGPPATRSSPMPNARSDARRCFRAGRPKGGSHWSTACRFIAPGVMPTPTPCSPSTGCSPRGSAGTPCNGARGQSARLASACAARPVAQ